ncbi:MAG: hypothetical protein K0R88_1027 [Solirubrobacterales bacterium]|nr:hypothetical protein [Solirubrobacterales bacterium]
MGPAGIRSLGKPAIDSAPVELEVVSAGLEELDADLVALALAEGEQLPEAIRDAPGAADVRPSACG